MKPCPKCIGTGSVKCPICKGGGLNPMVNQEALDAPECDYCDGLGEIPCPECDGLGEIG